MNVLASSLIFGSFAALAAAVNFGDVPRGPTKSNRAAHPINLYAHRLPAWMVERFEDEPRWFLCSKVNAVTVGEDVEDGVPSEPPNVAILRHEPGKTIDQHLSDWLRQIKMRVEFAGDGAVCYVTRTFTLNMRDVPEHLRDTILQEVRLAMNGQRRVNGMTIDGSRAGIHYE